MDGFAICAGLGGLELGLQIAIPGYRCIAAIEHDAEAALRFRHRFPKARIFQEALGFDGRPLHGIMDCVSAGFPCQPHSVAGRRHGTRDDRWVWPDIARIIREVNPGIVFLENVAGLLHDADCDLAGDLEESADGSVGGMGTVLRDLAEMGLIAAWGSVRASHAGAAHERDRVFILAVTSIARLPRYQPQAVPATQTDSERRTASQLRDALLEAFAPGPLDPAWNAILRSRPHLAPSLSPVAHALARALPVASETELHQEVESGFRGLADGVAHWLVGRRKRLRLAGNGVVPLQAALAFVLLTRKLQLTI